MDAPYPSNAAIEIAASSLKAWAKEKAVAIDNIRFTTVARDGKNTVFISIFYATDEELKSRIEDGTNEKLKIEFEVGLKNAQRILPFGCMPEKLDFEFDSHENVVKNYRGSYYFRFR